MKPIFSYERFPYERDYALTKIKNWVRYRKSIGESKEQMIKRVMFQIQWWNYVLKELKK